MFLNISSRLKLFNETEDTQGYKAKNMLNAQ